MIFVAKKEGKSPEIIAEITRLTTQRNLLAPQVTEMKNILEIAGHTLNETTGDIAIQALKKTGTKRILTAGASQEVQVESKKQEKILRNAALDTTARLTMVENILREQGFLDPKNLEKLKKLGLVDDRGALSKKAKDQILAGHSVGKPVLEQDF